MEKFNLFITIPPRIRKQLEISIDNDKLNYFEALGLSSEFTGENLSHSLNRSKLLLERLKYHPQYKEEAARVYKQLMSSSSILGNPQMRKEYEEALEQYRKLILEKKTERYKNLVKLSCTGDTLFEGEKNTLILYAQQRKIDIKTAEIFLSHYSTGKGAGDTPLAKPPHLTAPIPRYLETPAFQILVKKTEPILVEREFWICSNCEKQNVVTWLFCTCGSLMRGKMICPDCAVLFRATLSECPLCKKESLVMVELKQEDIPLVHSHIKSLSEKGKFEEAIRSCRDLLDIIPGDAFARKEITRLEQSYRRQTVQKGTEELERKGIVEALGGHFYEAYRILSSLKKNTELSEEAKEILEKSARIIVKKINRLLIVSAIISSIFLILFFLSFVIFHNKKLESFTIWAFCLLVFLNICMMTCSLYLSRNIPKTVSKKASEKSDLSRKE